MMRDRFLCVNSSYDRKRFFWSLIPPKLLMVSMEVVTVWGRHYQWSKGSLYWQWCLCYRCFPSFWGRYQSCSIDRWPFCGRGRQSYGFIWGCSYLWCHHSIGRGGQIQFSWTRSLAGVLIREFDKVTIRGYFVELLSKMEPRAVVCVWWWSTRTWVTCW